MTTWAAAIAKAEFEAVMDGAHAEGPQLVSRDGEDFIVLTRAEWEASETAMQQASASEKNAWERLRCAPQPGDPELELTRAKDDARWVNFEQLIGYRFPFEHREETA